MAAKTTTTPLSSPSRIHHIGAGFAVKQPRYYGDPELRVTDPKTLALEVQHLGSTGTYTIALEGRGIINLNREEAAELGRALIALTY